MGDVIGDLTKRRGKVLGTDQSESKKGVSIIEAEVPKSEMSSYSIQLRAITQGRATYSYEIQRYGEVPSNIAQKIIEEHKADVAE